ncbi:MAG: DUF5615 family PIN-like protein [Caldilineales bacterium]|nr:DUF5615 family PIN-like protein [Caldilineales bacterium]
MRFKVDENLPAEIAARLSEQGYDATTVLEQGLGGSADDEIASICQQEKRVLITLDVGFSDIRTYPPTQYPGIIVLRLTLQDKAHVLAVVENLLPILIDEPLASTLWIVEEDRIRIRS